MSVFRIEKTKNYTVMSNFHLKEKKMSLKAKGLLSLILSLPDDWDYSINGLATLSKDGVSAVRTTLTELELFGYLRIDKLYPDKTDSGRIEYTYNIFETPQLKQDGEKQDIENLHVENLHIENRIQLNTKELNTNNTDTISNDIVIDENEKSKNSQSKTTQLLANSLDDKTSNNITTSSLIEKPKKKVNKKQENIMTMKGMINTFTDNDEVKARLLDYFDIRLKRGLQPIQWKIILDDLRRAAKDNASQAVSLINAATAGGWLKIVYSDDNKSKAKFDNTAGRKVDAVVNMSQAEQENYRNNLAKDEFGNLMMF